MWQWGFTKVLVNTEPGKLLYFHDTVTMELQELISLHDLIDPVPPLFTNKRKDVLDLAKSQSRYIWVCSVAVKFDRRLGSRLLNFTAIQQF